MEETIRVLIVDDSEQTRENLRNILSLEKDIQVVGEAGNGQDAVQRTQELHADVVIMDVNMPGVDGIQATERITTDIPDATVVVMSAAGDQEYLRRAMQAGARDYLIKPFTSDEVVTAIKRVYDKGRQRRQREQGVPLRSTPADAKIITLYSPHDGAGKTTVAANLAIAIAMDTGEPVVLVDLNLQFGDLDLVLNLTPERTIVDLVPQFQHLDAGLIEPFLCPHDSGIRLLAAPPRPQFSESVTVYCVQQVLRVLRESYRYIIVDSASTLNDVTLAALDVSDEILLLTTLDVPALRNARISLETMRDLQYETEKIRLIINRATGELGIKADEAEEYLEHPVAARIPSEGRTVVGSVNQGVPFVISNPETKVAEAMHSLARLLAPESSFVYRRAPEPARKGFGMLLRSWAQRA
ncbi:MAG: response regulator [Armatimonadetes bacterium]|nr:response regulator [Armatimonadota bacterium]